MISWKTAHKNEIIKEIGILENLYEVKATCPKCGYILYADKIRSRKRCLRCNHNFNFPLARLCEIETLARTGVLWNDISRFFYYSRLELKQDSKLPDNWWSFTNEFGRIAKDFYSKDIFPNRDSAQ